MRSLTTRRFWALFDQLPQEAQDRARAAYRLFNQNPSHASLDFKRTRTRQAVYSARVGLHVRVLGILEGDTVVWFWIGTHGEYDKALTRL